MLGLAMASLVGKILGFVVRKLRAATAAVTLRINIGRRSRLHLGLAMCLLTAIILSLTFHQEIVYTAYIRIVNLERYRTAITFWSTDFHISPIHDLKDVLSPMGVQFMDKSLSGSCQRTKTCYSPLRILTRKNGMNPTDTVSARFYRFYQDQPEMNLVDAFVCFHPAAMCELYMPFNRSMIIIASTRYELARFEPAQWHRWNENLKQISRDPKNVIAANNRYDAEYIHYFTGIRAMVLTSFCGYTKSDYQPTRKEFLIAPIHNKLFQTVFMKSLRKSQDRRPASGIQIVPIRLIYDDYQYSDLTNHPAIIHIPYQVSVMSLFEQYRMNIPLFFPSLALLTEWHYEHQVVSERTWDHALFGIPPNRSHIQGVLKGVPDPNNDRDREAIRYWLKFADFYQWPHILYFESTDDLVQKLMSTNFHKVSQRMKKYNRHVAEDLRKKWTGILETVRQHSRKFQAIANAS